MFASDLPPFRKFAQNGSSAGRPCMFKHPNSSEGTHGLFHQFLIIANEDGAQDVYAIVELPDGSVQPVHNFYFRFTDNNINKESA